MNRTCKYTPGDGIIVVAAGGLPYTNLAQLLDHYPKLLLLLLYQTQQGHSPELHPNLPALVLTHPGLP